MGFAIGIDLGTANIRVAVHRDDQFEMIPHEGQSLMPSYVAFTDMGRLVGQAAKNQASVNPKNTVFNVLRFLGATVNDSEIKAIARLLPFEVTHDDATAEEKRKLVFKVMHKGVLTTFTPVAVLAMLLKRAKKDAEEYLGHPVVWALITLPSSFNLSQRFAIHDAAVIAGLQTLRLIHSPTVSLADWLVTQKLPGERNVLICDIGAGYYGVVLATVEEGIQDVKAGWWDTGCVGEDYDRRLMNHMINYFKRTTKDDSTITDIISNPRALRRLRAACEKAKHQLSSAHEAIVEIEQLHGGKDLRTSITRQRFEELIQDLVRSLCDPIERVLRDAKMDKSSVHDVVLIGGSSRIPKIQKIMADFFNGKDPSRCLNLEETSARGAAFHAAILSGDTSSKTTMETILMDATSRSFGIETAGGIMTPLIKRGTTIPTKKSEVFSTFQDNQEFFLVTYFEGERARIKDCMELGHAQVPVPLAPRGVPQLEVTLDIDSNYIINTTIVEKGTGKKSSVRLNGENARSFDRLSKEGLERLIYAEEKMEDEDNLEAERIEARNDAEELIYSIKDWTSTIPLERRVNGVARLEHLADMLLSWIDDSQFAAVFEYKSRTEQLQNLREDVVAQQDNWEVSGQTVLDAAEKKKEQAFEPVDDATLPPSMPSQTQQNPAPTPNTSSSHLTMKPLAIHSKRATVEEVPDETRVEDEGLRAPLKASQFPILHSEETAPEHRADPIVAARSETAVNDNENKSVNESKSHITGLDQQSAAGPSVSPVNNAKMKGERADAGFGENLERVDALAEPEPSSNLSFTPTPTTVKISEIQNSERAETPGTAERGMSSLFTKSADGTLTYTDTEFIQISTYLKNTGQLDWSKIPRLYTVLRLIDQLDMLEVFVQQGITDIWFPFAQTTLPRALSPSARANFLKQQELVLSKSLLFEKSPGRKHARFLQGQPLPYEVVAKLGAGAHGQVDKVMSTVSHREYARKLFRRVRGMSKDAVNSFLVELQVLKRVQHYHCIELVQSYTDPKYFALIMSPVGDCNMLEYYSLALNNSDKSSLLRSFFGCLANALQYIHSIKIRHRDIKPHNILVRGDRVFLTDFGIALDWEELSRSTTTADSGKTWVYAAPEVAKYEKRNTAADVWSLGCVFLEMATILKGQSVNAMRKFFDEASGNYRFYANVAQLSSWADSCRQLGSEKDDVVFDWVLLMLEEDPEKRPTAATLHHDISVECSRQGVPFSGTCCLEAVDSSGVEDEDDDEAWDIGGEDMTLVPGKVPEMA